MTAASRSSPNLAGKLLDVVGMNTDNGAALQIWRDENGTTQYWTISEVTRKPKASAKASAAKAKAELTAAAVDAAEEVVKAVKKASTKPAAKKAAKAVNDTVKAVTETVKPAAGEAVKAAKPVVKEAVQGCQARGGRGCQGRQRGCEARGQEDCRQEAGCQEDHHQEGQQVIRLILIPLQFCVGTSESPCPAARGLFCAAIKKTGTSFQKFRSLIYGKTRITALPWRCGSPPRWRAWPAGSCPAGCPAPSPASRRPDGSRPGSNRRRTSCP